MMEQNRKQGTRDGASTRIAAARPLLVTGAEGQLGAALVPRLRDQYGEQVQRWTRHELDLTQTEKLKAGLDLLRPQVIINTAAWTQVDLAEHNVDAVMAINRDVPQQLARWAAKNDAVLIQLSTDYVFDGRARQPYREMDPRGPLSVYGSSKAQAEALVQKEGARAYLLRTSWLLGLREPGFLSAILGRVQRGEPLRVVADRYGSPTPVDWLACALVHLVQCLLAAPDLAPPGVYHLAGQGVATWWEVAAETLALLAEHEGRGGNGPSAVQAIAAADYPSLAIRPDYSCLDSRLFCQTFAWPPLDWQQGLAQVLQPLLRNRVGDC